MPEFSMVQIAATLADMYDLPYAEVRDDLSSHLAGIDAELEREVDVYLSFVNEAGI